MLARTLLAVALCTAPASGARAALEILLASTSSCNSCEIFRRAAEARGYGDALSYNTGTGVVEIPIRAVANDDLPAAIIAQLPADLRQSRDWDLMLTVIVVDEDRVLAAGNIAESADNRELVHAGAVMFPPDDPEDDDPALTGQDLYVPFFTTHWNLEYFVDVALGVRAPRDPSPLIDLAAADPIRFGAANVVLWGSAGTPLANALFIPSRINEIRAQIESLGIGGLRILTLFGHGPAVAGNDSSFITNGKTHFARADVPADLAADAASLNRVFTGLASSDGSHTLLIQVGHSGPVGSPLWGSGLTLLPDDVAAIKERHNVDLVMVSGACNSGMFAAAVQCGLFAAHPEVVASGCQLSAEALETSDDYLRYFFRAATAVSGRNDAATTATLEDAHWYATQRLENHQISYTTADAIIDAYFASHPNALPVAMTVTELVDGRTALDPAESAALLAMTSGLAPDRSIDLTGYVDVNHRAQAELADATELSSAARNAITSLPYKLSLAQLARRLVYRRLGLADSAFRDSVACTQRTLPELLGAR